VSQVLALLGDSIFDNRRYTKGEPEVVQHLGALLPTGWSASLLAVDGSTTADLAGQIARVTPLMSHLVVSIGGNDALLNADILNLPAASTREALLLFGQRAARSEASYRVALQSLSRLERRTTVCTIYNGNLPAAEAPVARVALMLFNDAILRVAFELGLDVIDLRLVCTEPSDYANPIEPSGQGGAKIAQAIVRSLGVAQQAVSSVCT
jgi:hypothetical protein